MAEGKIIAISISEKKGQKKHNIESANLIVDHGMEGDAHAGNWHRQISLLGIASIDHMRAQGADVKPGDFAENITVEMCIRDSLHAGPIVRDHGDDNFEMISVGPTTSMRMEKFEYEFVKQTGVRLIVGKGGMRCV